MLEYDGDPELGNEDDPAYMSEIFAEMKESGVLPSDLPDPKDQAEYVAYLASNPEKSNTQESL
jgi:hypothetical protein